MREVVAGAGGGVAPDVDGPAAPSGPAALQSLGFVLPEGTFDGIAFSVYRLSRRRGKSEKSEGDAFVMCTLKHRLKGISFNRSETLVLILSS